ncbi:MAG: NADPH:quinone oxidoreductase family protein [Acidimicrobiia bacterium]|nr:MAG: NADPH:quinone oxidoreductase family protein [Acidimicrobiia bacterium]
MRAVVCREFGPVDRLELAELPDPEPGPGEVVIDVSVAAMNFPDTLIVQGNYQVRPEPPFSPGFEGTGVISAVGDGVTLQVGSQVVAAFTHGSFAEKWLVPAASVLAFPNGLSLEEAAGFTITYGTSFYALSQRGQLGKGEVLLVLGAAGGVGSAAVELGKIMGATVIAAASTEDKLSFAASLGADHTINYTEQELKAAVKEFTDGRGVDVVYDPVGGELSETAFRTIAWGGRHLVIGFAAGDIPAIPLNLPLLKGASIVGAYWGDWLREEPHQAAETVAELYELAAAGRVHPRVSDVFALEQYADGYAALTSRAAKGKVLLRVAEPSFPR